MAFPNRQHTPAHSFQGFFISFITSLVLFNFFSPKFSVSMRYDSVHLMAMPKTPMNEYHYPIFAQHDVGRSRKALHIFAVTIAPVIQIASHEQFRLCILTTDFSHDGRALFFIPNIHEQGGLRHKITVFWQISHFLQQNSHNGTPIRQETQH